MIVFVVVFYVCFYVMVCLFCIGFELFIVVVYFILCWGGLEVVLFVCVYRVSFDMCL